MVEVVARAVPVEPVPIISIDSDHLPPPFRAPWCERRPFAMSINSAEFGEDDPERLRCSGSQAVGRAMVGMAEGVQLSPHRDVREIAQLVLQWFAEDAGRYEDLGAAIGLRPNRGSSISYRVRLAERDAALGALGRLPPYDALSPSQAAAEIRRDLKRYLTTRWAEDRQRRTAPVTEGGTRAEFWRIARASLERPMPKNKDAAAMIRAARDNRSPI
ncbi:hypothetical protein ORIO_00560 [Cereibacter azotoformans]|uniref:hypothetical protein n=1 Tax=Cereibacter azotoformans TaxID=43057 RepID=UPI001EEB4BB3|nr:hypothetical protein [Cereibacter azotoformans]ULB08433.1 hypothetical protein ORIO_00560 [Cereibacter azotoformans]